MRKINTFMLVVLIAAMLVSCAKPTAEIIFQTQVVEKEVVKTQVVEKEVIKTQVVEKEVVKEVITDPDCRERSCERNHRRPGPLRRTAPLHGRSRRDPHGLVGQR